MIELIGGKSAYLAEKAWQEKRAEYEQEYGKESVVIVDCESSEWSDIHQAIEGMSLFGPEEKLVIVRNINANKDIINRLNEYVEHINSSTYVLVVEAALDKRSGLYKSIKREGLISDFSEPKEYELVSWVEKDVAAKNGHITKQVAQLLVGRVGLQQMQLTSEIDKLLAYDNTITEDTIKLLVTQSLQDTIFELLEAVANGRGKEAIAIYENLRAMKEQPIYILTMLGWQMHIFIAVLVSGNSPDAAIAKRAGSSPYAVGKAKRVVRRLSRQQITAMTKLIADADYKLKTKSIDQDHMLKTLILRLIEESR